jgi:hypothetical protein
MTLRRYDSEGADCADALAEAHDAETAAEARSLTGQQVVDIRQALAVAATVMARINAKGMPHAHRQELQTALWWVRNAQGAVAKRAAAPDHPDTARPSDGPSTTAAMLGGGQVAAG